MNDDDIEGRPALYRYCCTGRGIEPLPGDEARELARRFHEI